MFLFSMPSIRGNLKDGFSALLRENDKKKFLFLEFIYLIYGIIVITWNNSKEIKDKYNYIFMKNKNIFYKVLCL